MLDTKVTPCYDIFELSLSGPRTGNPFIDIALSATFEHDQRAVTVDGFYDGDGVYMVRFMPDKPGEWRFSTRSDAAELDGRAGTFHCVAPRSAAPAELRSEDGLPFPPHAGVHGPVRVSDTYHFAYADGTRYIPVGTTCYAWVHQGDELEEQTLRTLRAAPFNKMRMCIFPKDYNYNHNEPDFFIFERDAAGKWDTTRFNPAFFRHLEQRIGQLMELGIEADLILFHPYDRWGFSDLGADADDRYLRYLIARLGAFRNVWWSLANEFDLMRSKTLADWDRFFHILVEKDPYQHLRSIHQCFSLYDHSQPWVTHASIQHGDVVRVKEWRDTYHKPVVIDECGYEGNIEEGWGNFTPQEHARRFWVGAARGGYVGHGETYYNPEEILWWSKGGTLCGHSPQRIAFLRAILEDAPAGLTPTNDWAFVGSQVGDDYFLHFLDSHQPIRFTYPLPEEGTYTVDIIDTWEMTVTPAGTFRGKVELAMPGKAGLAIRIRKLG
jgi:hypothetical protein